MHCQRLLLTFALLVSGCSDRPESPNEAGLAWSIDPQPMLDIRDTSVAGPAVLESARFATRLSSGNVVVADQYADVLRFFDPGGRVVRVVGRKGRGPGEFADVTWIGQCGTDSLFVWAHSRRTMIVFDTAGNFGREYRPQGNPQEVTCSRNGQFGMIGIPNAYVPPNADGDVMTAPIWLADARGDSIRWFGEFSYAENRALGKLTRIASGEGVLYIGTADSAWIDMYGENGGLLRTIPVGVEPPAPTQAAYDRAIDRLIAITPNREAREMFRATYSALPMPDHLPPYTDLHVDPSGLLWAVVPSTNDSETHLRAITSSAFTAIEVAVPKNIIVFEIGLTYVLGAYKDDSDLDRLVLFRLNRPQ